MISLETKRKRNEKKTEFFTLCLSVIWCILHEKRNITLTFCLCTEKLKCFSKTPLNNVANFILDFVVSSCFFISFLASCEACLSFLTDLNYIKYENGEK